MPNTGYVVNRIKIFAHFPMNHGILLKSKTINNVIFKPIIGLHNKHSYAFFMFSCVVDEGLIFQRYCKIILQWALGN